MSDIALKFLVANLATVLAILIVMLLRKRVRAHFGARLAYSLWLLAPLAATGSLLPPRIVEIVQPAPAMPDISTPLAAPPSEAGANAEALAAPAQPPSLAVAPSTAIDPWTIATLVWLLGVVAMLIWQLRNQSRFMADARAGFAGPAIVGFIRPRIVTPADFDQRFDPAEREVVLAHETIHIDRNDARINAGVALVRCLCWFNPLVHVAAHLMRIDQELACDAAVAERFPRARSVYASALLKAELAARPLPLGCYWPAGAEHPLTERIEMLKQASPSHTRRLAGIGALGLLAAAASVSAWAFQPPETHSVLEVPQDQPAPAPQPLQKPQWQAHIDAVAPPGFDGAELQTISGKVEKIDFTDTQYTVFVRAITVSGANGWGSRANTALWQLNPTPYWGERAVINADLMGKRILVSGFNALDRTCAPTCRMHAASIRFPKATALPELSTTPDFSLTDFALHYDTGRPTFFSGKVKRIVFGERVFDAYVETEGWGGNPNWTYQVRSEYRHPRAEIEKALLNQTISLAGWLARLPADAVYDSPTGVYGTEFQLPDGRKISPAGATLVSADKLAAQRWLELAETKPGEPSLGPALWEPNAAKLPTIPDAYFQRGPQAFDMNAPVVIDGKIVRADDDGWWVEVIGFEPASTGGAKTGALWRVVGGYKDKQNDIGKRLTARGYNAKDANCQPYCRMNAAGGIWLR